MAAVDTQMDAFEVMRRGCPMTRNGNTWTHYDFRMFQLSEDHRSITWSKKSAMAEERIPISSILRIHEGQSTKTFQKDPKKPVEHLSFSIVFCSEDSDEAQTYDLICCRQSDTLCWVRGLRHLMERGVPLGIESECIIDLPEATVDTSLAALLHRTKSQQAGRMAWAIPLAIVPIAGIAWLGYTAYYRNQDKKDIVAARLPEMKALISQIRALLQGKLVRGHPFVEGDAKLRLQFIGECYEAAANIKDSVLKETLDAQLHNVAIGLAEAQALSVKLQIIDADARKGMGWFESAADKVASLNPWRGSTDDAKEEQVELGEVGKTADDLPEIKCL